jgi:hypothetical protein
VVAYWRCYSDIRLDRFKKGAKDLVLKISTGYFETTNLIPQHRTTRFSFLLNSYIYSYVFSDYTWRLDWQLDSLYP